MKFNNMNSKLNEILSIEDKRNINDINKSTIFKCFLGLKIFFLIIFTPEIFTKWFIPFMQNGINGGFLNPWFYHFQALGDQLAFPYGISMYISYLPLTWLGFFTDNLIGSTFFTKFGFALTSLFFDYSTLIAIALIAKKFSNKVILIAYWCSPISIYILYFHGQLDIVPVFFLLSSIFLLEKRLILLSAVLFGLAISAKFSMLAALPMLMIYIKRNQKLSKYFYKYLISLGLILIVLVTPYLFLREYNLMVIGSPQATKLFSLYINYGEDLKLFILPTVYITLLYLIWRLEKITFDLFIIALGLSFFILLLLLPPSPGWFLWILPFLTFYQLRCPRDYLIVSLPFYFIYLIFNILFSSGSSFELFNYNYEFNLVSELLKNSRLYSFLFTALQASGLILCIRMYIYGINRNNLFRKGRRPLIVGITGLPNSGKLSLSNSLVNLLGRENCLIFNDKDYKRWDDKNPILNTKSRLNPNSFDLSKLSQDLFEFTNLKSGVDNVHKQPLKRIGRKIKNLDLVLVNGSNILNLKRIRKRLDLKIFIEIDDLIKGYISKVNSRNIKTKSTPILINEKKDQDIYVNQQKANSDLFFQILPVNRELCLEQINKGIEPKLKLNITMLNGYFHEKLCHDLISLCGTYIDTKNTDYIDKVNICLEGEVTSEDISVIANSLIPNLSDLITEEQNWNSNYQGLIQLVTLKHITDLLIGE